MTWEVYKPVKNNRISTEPKITIKDGKFSFNAFIRDNYLKGIDFITILMDKKANKVGLQLKEKKDENTIKLSRAKSGNNVLLNATPFFKMNNIDTSKTKSYDVEYNEKEKIMVIDLKKAQEVKYSPRTANKKQKQGQQEVHFEIKPQSELNKANVKEEVTK